MPNPNFFTKIFDAVAELQRNGINLFESDSFSVRRVFGGSNNALYKIKSQTETLACKLIVLDGRNRALREFEALKAIRAAEYDIAPNPLLLDESLSIVQFPTVLYQWAEGYVLQPPIRQQHLETFLNSYHQLHSIQPSNHTDFQLDAWFHWFNFDAYLAEITEFFNLYTPWLETESSGGLKLRDRLQMPRVVFGRVVNVSERTIAKVESTAAQVGKLRRPYNEIFRLYQALSEVVEPETLGAWFMAPNEAFEGLKPIEVIERGEIDRLWEMVFRLRSGMPG